jgi:hypothetical protein
MSWDITGYTDGWPSVLTWRPDVPSVLVAEADLTVTPKADAEERDED